MSLDSFSARRLPLARNGTTGKEIVAGSLGTSVLCGSLEVSHDPTPYLHSLAVYPGIRIRGCLHRLRKNSGTPAVSWKSGASAACPERSRMGRVKRKNQCGLQPRWSPLALPLGFPQPVQACRKCCITNRTFRRSPTLPTFHRNFDLSAQRAVVTTKAAH
jgi:hypothetical protein